MQRQCARAVLPVAGLLLGCSAWAAAGPQGEDPLQPWRDNVAVRPVCDAPGRHTIHSYYLACPESPDGSRVLFYASSAADGQRGDLCVLDRATGRETVIARNLETEDAHRAACQQWVSGGRRVAFHDVRGGRWGVYAVTIDPPRERLVALDRQLGFATPASNLLPIYGCHWNPGTCRDLELADVASGELRAVVRIGEVQRSYGDWLNEEFGGKPVSIFFPVMSPDQKRVFFKIACGSGGDEFRSSSASKRQGLIVCDLPGSRFLCMSKRWGHPAWHPDSRHILEVGNLLYDVQAEGKISRIAHLPRPRGCHPSVSPDGRLIVMDGLLEPPDGAPGEYGIWVCDIRGGEGRYQILHRFDNRRGAKSWRRNDPHPVFSPDGTRIYFNVSDSAWTRLYVAQCSPPRPTVPGAPGGARGAGALGRPR